MIVDDSFNYHSLSLTIISAFKRFVLVKEWTMSSVRPSNSGCTRMVGRAHEGSVRDALGAAESIFSYLSKRLSIAFIT